MVNASLSEKLYEQICEIEIIDTHEHLANQDMLGALGHNLAQEIELGYLKDDLMALGMDGNLILEKGSDESALIEELIPFLRKTRNTSYFQSLFRAFYDLHGLPEGKLDKESLEAVSKSIVEAYSREDWYRYVLREQCNIKCMLRDMGYMVATDDFVTPIVRMDCFLMLRHRHLLPDWIERAAPAYGPYITELEYNDTIHSLDDYLALIESEFQRAIDFGGVGIKIGIAYERTLQFDNVSVKDANRVFMLPDEKTTTADIKTFQDFILFRIIENATKRKLPVQIHTGVLAGGKAVLANSNPLHLNNIFLEFPDARFDVFHGAFPFMGEIGSLALMFPNVHLDMCWLPLISYINFKNALSEWLCYVPAGKFLWGGDCHSAESVYGAVYTMRKGLSEVLAEKIDQGLLDKELAMDIARKILHDNAKELFRL